MTDHATTLAGTFPYTPISPTAPASACTTSMKAPPTAKSCSACTASQPGATCSAISSRRCAGRRVVVPDHMGFGKSETPQGRSYWLQDHIDNLERLVLSLDLTGITLVMHDFGGPVGMGLAARHPDRIRRVISANGPTPFGQATLPQRVMANAAESPWFRWIAKAEADGSLETVLGQLGFNILSTLKLNGFEHNAIISDAGWRPMPRHSPRRPTAWAPSAGPRDSPPVLTASKRPMRRRSGRSAANRRSRSGERRTARSALSISCPVHRDLSRGAGQAHGGSRPLLPWKMPRLPWPAGLGVHAPDLSGSRAPPWEAQPGREQRQGQRMGESKPMPAQMACFPAACAATAAPTRISWSRRGGRSR